MLLGTGRTDNADARRKIVRSRGGKVGHNSMWFAQQADSGRIDPAHWAPRSQEVAKLWAYALWLCGLAWIKNNNVDLFICQPSPPDQCRICLRRSMRLPKTTVMRTPRICWRAPWHQCPGKAIIATHYGQTQRALLFNFDRKHHPFAVQRPSLLNKSTAILLQLLRITAWCPTLQYLSGSWRSWRVLGIWSQLARSLQLS